MQPVTFFDWVEVASWGATVLGAIFVVVQLKWSRDLSEVETLFQMEERIRNLTLRVADLPDGDTGVAERLLKDFLNTAEVYAMGIAEGRFSRIAKQFAVDLLRAEIRSLADVPLFVELLRHRDDRRNTLRYVRQFAIDNALLTREQIL